MNHTEPSVTQAWPVTLGFVSFTPCCRIKRSTAASWLNMVERFFRDITTGRLRRGVCRSVPELNAAIKEYIAAHNKNPKPFVWTAKVNDILQKVIRANRRLSSKQNDSLHECIPACRMDAREQPGAAK